MYTNVYQAYNELYVRGVENGRRFAHKVDFQPTIWVSTAKANTQSDWKTLEGRTVYPIQPGSMDDCRKYLEMYKGVEGVSLWESPGPAYQYIAETYKGELRFNPKDITVYTIDIETETERGFPDTKFPQETIQLITIKDTQHNKIITWGLKEFNNDVKHLEYRHFTTEQSLLKDFIVWWQRNYPDVITGWNTRYFDLPYIYNRMVEVIGQTLANKLSPWGRVRASEDKQFGNHDKTRLRVQIAGIADLDYLELYRKFTYTAQESYQLDYIASVELNERKLENPGNSFKDFYSKHWDTFVRYNIRDVELVDRIDAKMKLMELALTIAYAAKVNYEDVFGPVKVWDIIIYNYLNERNVVIPQRKPATKATSYEGAYVKDPLVGKHYNTVSFDLNSLYPMLICQYNMSPETITNTRMNVTVNDLLEKKCDLSEVYDKDLSMAANGWCFRKDQKGILPIQMQLFYDRRKQYKKEMISAKQKLEAAKDAKDKEQMAILKNEVARLNNLQMAMKILINSAYGAMGNAYFRYFDPRIAEGITKSGQLSIRWVANRLNALMDKTLKTEGKDRIVLIDTDSVVLTLEDLINKVCPNKTTEEKIKYMDDVAEKIIQPVIDKTYQELATYMNAYEQKMQMKRENLVDVMVSVSKKRYVMSVHNSEGVQYKEPQLKIMGLQMVKSSTPSVIRTKLKEALPKIMYGEQKEVQDFVAQFREEFYSLSPAAIAFPRSVNDLEAYSDETWIYKKATPIHVRGSLLYNHYLNKYNLMDKYPQIKDGTKIKFLYLKLPNILEQNCVAFIDKIPEEFDLTSRVDYDMMFEKTFEDAIQNILDALGWSTVHKPSLDDMFA